MDKRVWMASAFVLGAGGVTTAMAADPGFYAGFSIGQTEVDDLNSVVGGPLLPGGQDDTDTAWKIFGGYQFNKYWGVEAAWNDLGDFNRGPSTADIDGVSIAAVGTWPVANQFNLLGKAGIFAWDVNRNAASDDDGADATLGLGAEYVVVPDVAVRAEWEWFDNVGDSEVNVLTVGISTRF